MSLKFTLDRSYGLVLLSATAIGFQCYFTGYIVPMGMRKQVFSKEYMEKNFGEIHAAEVGGKLPSLGYPDMGSGRYAEKLPYKDWFELNNAMRTHQQFVEQVGIVIPFVLIGGLSAPKLAAAFGFSYFTGRLLYTAGYTTKEGPSARGRGAGLSTFSFLGVGSLSLYTAYKLLRYAKP